MNSADTIFDKLEQVIEQVEKGLNENGIAWMLSQSDGFKVTRETRRREKDLPSYAIELRVFAGLGIEQTLHTQVTDDLGGRPIVVNEIADQLFKHCKDLFTTREQIAEQRAAIRRAGQDEIDAARRNGLDMSLVTVEPSTRVIGQRDPRFYFDASFFMLDANGQQDLCIFSAVIPEDVTSYLKGTIIPEQVDLGARFGRMIERC